MRKRYSLGALALVIMLAPAAVSHASPITFRPAGANYVISAWEGIAPHASPVPTTLGTQASVNFDFEFDGSIGGQKAGTDWGIGVYGTSTAPFSTGLKLWFDAPINTGTMLGVTLADFDVKGTVVGVSHPVFNAGKVVPNFLLLDALGNILSPAFGPTPLAAAMTWVGDVDYNGASKGGNEDTWKLNVAGLPGASNLTIGGFVLYADYTPCGTGLCNEKLPSDPYFIVSADNGAPVVPEPATIVLLGSGLVIGAKRLRRRRG